MTIDLTQTARSRRLRALIALERPRRARPTRRPLFRTERGGSEIRMQMV